MINKWALGHIGLDGNLNLEEGPYDTEQDCLALVGDEGQIIVRLSSVPKNDVAKWRWSTRQNKWKAVSKV
jgi:hypothetical protein